MLTQLLEGVADGAALLLVDLIPSRPFQFPVSHVNMNLFFLRAGSPSGAKQSGNYSRVQRAIQPNIITSALWSQMNTTQLCSEHSKSKQLP